MNHHPHHDKASVHGMLLFGANTIYLSHLPMFMSPHNYQVLLEATLTGDGVDPQELYVQDRETTGEKVYTLVPEKFVLSDLASEGASRPRRRSFKGTIFHGHFEREGTPIVEDITVTIERVLHFRKFDPDAEGLEHLQYLLFGKAGELYLAHLVTRAPDFDQVISARISGHEFTDEQLGQTIAVAFPQRENLPEDRIREDEKEQGLASVTEGDASRAIELTVEPEVEFYFETGDLAS